MTDRLLSQLQLASTDTERAAILQAADPESLERLAGEIFHRQIWAEAAEAIAQQDDFTRALEAAADDEARLQIITEARAQHGDAWLADWAFWRTATPATAGIHYIETIR